MCMYVCIYTNLPGNAKVRLPHLRRGDSQGQETFLAPSADSYTSGYDTYICPPGYYHNGFVATHVAWALGHMSAQQAKHGG